MILQAITTKYLAPTNTRGARIKASCSRGSITISYPYEMRNSDGHVHAAKQLIQKFLKEDLDEKQINPKHNPWAFPFASGQQENGNYVHVFTA